MMKKLLCIMLAVMMVLTLTACSKPLSESIIGAWNTTLTLDFEEAELEGFDNTLEIPVVITFEEGGDVTIEVVEDLTKQVVADLEADLVEYMLDTALESLEADGYGREEALEIMNAYLGMDLEAYVTDAIQSMNLYDSLVSSIESEVEYEVDDENLILEIDGEELEVEMDGDTLIIKEAENEEEWEERGFEFPVELTREEE